ncbi:MAG: restriction endonuclease [Verrucomicrobia bacterium]|nr:restriction endonuclease [Verrucomicrobiota bacterium]
MPRRRLHEADFPEPVESIFTTQTYVIAFLVIGGGGGYLLWRRQQRQLDLAATAVSQTPFSVQASTGSAAMFDASLLAKLEWKRFEELVASYYSKTGVVAVRTKTGPSSPVHVKISWKGEPRPFACVHCIAHPSGLIDAKPVQELYAVLAAEDIRRGYVVTTGKFSIPARDFAEEKHLTLLSGDLFLEKLNALPDSARAELMEEITAGDYTTPSCPKCDAKAVRADDSSAWHCRTHPDVIIPVRK